MFQISEQFVWEQMRSVELILIVGAENYQYTSALMRERLKELSNKNRTIWSTCRASRLMDNNTYTFNWDSHTRKFTAEAQGTSGKADSRKQLKSCGCRIRQATDKSVTVDQESYARKIDLITMSAHRRKHMTETLSNEEHTTMMAKRGELNWLATQTMSQLLAPLSLIDTSKTATGQSLKDLNRLVRQAHCEASDKLHYPVIFDPVFVSFADAAWANRKDFGSQCGYLCIGTERSLLNGSAAPCCPISWHSRRCPRVARSSSSAETQSATQAQEETEFIRLLWLEIVQGGYDDTVIDQEIAKVGGCLIIDAKGVFDAIHRSESAALSMQEKRSAVEGLA